MAALDWPNVVALCTAAGTFVGTTIGVVLLTLRAGKAREVANDDRAAQRVTARRVSLIEHVVVADHTKSAPRVLLVEDEPSMAKVLVRGMQMEGFAVDVAHTAEEAKLMAAASHQYAHHIVDIHLPDGNGVDLLNALRPTTIIYSGDVDALERLKNERVADAFVEKTGDITLLIEALRSL